MSRWSAVERRTAIAQCYARIPAREIGPRQSAPLALRLLTLARVRRSALSPVPPAAALSSADWEVPPLTPPPAPVHSTSADQCGNIRRMARGRAATPTASRKTEGAPRERQIHSLLRPARGKNSSENCKSNGLFDSFAGSLLAIARTRHLEFEAAPQSAGQIVERHATALFARHALTDHERAETVRVW